VAVKVCDGLKPVWAVKLYIILAEWLDFPRQLTPTAVDKWAQGEAKYYSHEAGYRNAQIFIAIYKARKDRDTDREQEYYNRLSKPKSNNLRSFLKLNPTLADALFEIK